MQEALSRFNHEDGTSVKKPLSQRHHEFSDGSPVQRDLYTAYPALFADSGRGGAKRAAAASADSGGAVGVGTLL
jgi:hypothetical protein